MRTMVTRGKDKFKSCPTWRHRIGLIVPSTNTVCEMDFHRLAPKEVSIHTGRMMILEEMNGPMDWNTPMDWEKIHQRMHEKCVDVAKGVASARVDLIVFGCTSGSFIRGPGFDREISRRIEEAVLPICGKIPVVTTSTAVVEALREQKIQKVSVATPYVETGNEQERIFLEGNGFKVVNIKGLGLETFGEYARQEPQVVYDLVKKLDKDAPDGIFISCTDFRALDVIEILEKDLRKPLISSNQASLWLSLKKLGLNETIKGYGALLRGSY
jgi:maleate isomerase